MKLAQKLILKKTAITVLSLVMVVGVEISYAGVKKQACRSTVNGRQPVSQCSKVKTISKCGESKYVMKENDGVHTTILVAPCYWDTIMNYCTYQKSTLCEARKKSNF